MMKAAFFFTLALAGLTTLQAQSNFIEWAERTEICNEIRDKENCQADGKCKWERRKCRSGVPPPKVLSWSEWSDTLDYCGQFKDNKFECAKQTQCRYRRRKCISVIKGPKRFEDWGEWKKIEDKCSAIEDKRQCNSDLRCRSRQGKCTAVRIAPPTPSPTRSPTTAAPTKTPTPAPSRAYDFWMEESTHCSQMNGRRRECFSERLPVGNPHAGKSRCIYNRRRNTCFPRQITEQMSPAPTVSPTTPAPTTPAPTTEFDAWVGDSDECSGFRRATDCRRPKREYKGKPVQQCVWSSRRRTCSINGRYFSKPSTPAPTPSPTLHPTTLEERPDVANYLEELEFCSAFDRMNLKCKRAKFTSGEDKGKRRCRWVAESRQCLPFALTDPRPQPSRPSDPSP